MSLYKLPDELLLIIFNYCNAHDLIQLSGVCKRFYDIASEFLIKESDNILVTGQMSEKFRERCQPLLSSYRKKFYIYNNWKRGRYVSKTFHPKIVSSSIFQCDDEEYTYRNRLQMTKDVILLASDIKSTNKLCAFNRTKNGLVSHDNMIVAKSDTRIIDIFVPCNDIIVTNHGDGSIRQWTIESLDEKKYFNETLLHSPRSIFDDWHMDVTTQLIVTGVDMSEIELWKYIPEENSIMNKYIPDLNVNLLEDPTFEAYANFITFDSTGTKFAAEFKNISEYYNRFIIYDINKCYTEIDTYMEDLDFKLCPVYQILWKEPNDIFFLAYDIIIQMDTRTHKVVQKWNASMKYNLESFTCMSTDNQYAIMTGTSCGKVVLWDRRKSNFIQVYDKDNVGYVHCLQFDSSRMYVAADNGIYEFDFTKL